MYIEWLQNNTRYVIFTYFNKFSICYKKIFEIILLLLNPQMRQVKPWLHNKLRAALLCPYLSSYVVDVCRVLAFTLQVMKSSLWTGKQGIKEFVMC